MNGQLRTSRYSSYYPLAVNKLKYYLRKGYFNSKNIYDTLSIEKIEKINDTITLDEILKLVGQDFYVIIPCLSIRNIGTKFEGTRLTVVNHPPDGIEFTIRTPGFLGRWIQFEKELDFCYQKLIDSLTLIKDHKTNYDDNDDSYNDNNNHNDNNDDNNGSNNDINNNNNNNNNNNYNHNNNGSNNDINKNDNNNNNDYSINHIINSSSNSNLNMTNYQSINIYDTVVLNEKNGDWNGNKNKKKDNNKDEDIDSNNDNNNNNDNDNNDNNDNKNNNNSNDTYNNDTIYTLNSNMNDPTSSSIKNTKITKKYVTEQHKEILKMSLEFFYFWINFAPLTRGTAACGYSVILSIMLSCGISFSQPLPDLIQLDWEAIFAENSKDFVERMYVLLPIEISSLELDNFPVVENTILTFRSMIKALL